MRLAYRTLLIACCVLAFARATWDGPDLRPGEPTLNAAVDGRTRVQTDAHEFSDEAVGAVTCGSSVSLRNPATRARLFSQELQLNMGSRQQVVTANPSRGHGEALWTVSAEANGRMCPAGALVRCGSKIQLLHASTRAFLHSHDRYYAPISGNDGNYEVTGFSEVNAENDWIVECGEKSHKGEFWKREANVKFKHAVSGLYLCAHKRNYDGPIAAHFEVYSSRSAGDNRCLWATREGMYMSHLIAERMGENGKAVRKEMAHDEL